MLKIIYILKPFFEDNYRRINVREYARLQKISPPTASKILEQMHKEKLLKKETERLYIYYCANKDSDLLIDLSRIYWKGQLEKVGLLELIEQELLNPVVILFGSLSKAEAKKDSDTDLAIFSPTKKILSIEKYEKLLKRKIQLFRFTKREEVENINLLNNILNGYVIKGSF
ncbi:nucleotidyltransferase domain-containing protein [Candidatus Woesearchaeota archaeon]|nr:nucleotidyltransferase domain-containing protein [Candidatus Woesearchaeota archaeon]